VASGSEDDDDPLREARAYNHSIYLMVGMPYLLVSGMGFYLYRGLKQSARRNNAIDPDEPGSGVGP
jgi:hypothetical protein